MSFTPPDLSEAKTPEGEARFREAIAHIRSSGMLTFQLRVNDEDDPVVWVAVARQIDGRQEVAASFDPVEAVVRLAQRLGVEESSGNSSERS